MTYTTPFSGNMSIEFSGGGSYASSYYTQQELAPWHKQKGYWTFDAGVRAFSENRAWEVALIGKNLTNKIRAQFSFDAPFTPDATGALAGTGTNGPTVGADANGFVNRPRQVMIQLTLRPSEF